MTPTRNRLPRKDSLFKSFNSQDQSIEAGKFHYNDPFNLMRKSIPRSLHNTEPESFNGPRNKELYQESDSDEELTENSQKK